MKGGCSAQPSPFILLCAAPAFFLADRASHTDSSDKSRDLLGSLAQ